LLGFYNKPKQDLERFEKKKIDKANERKKKFQWEPTPESSLRIRVGPKMFLNLPSMVQFQKIKETSLEFRQKLKEYWARFSEEFSAKWTKWPVKTRESEFIQCVQKIRDLDFDIFDSSFEMIYDVFVPELDPRIVSHVTDYLPKLVEMVINGTIFNSEPERNKAMYQKYINAAKDAQWPVEFNLQNPPQIAHTECIPVVRQTIFCKILSMFVQSVIDDYDDFGNFDHEKAMHSLLMNHFGGNSEA